ncbi:MAG TPA: DEAD/DEAH box helicase [Candidatus Binatia bacterium]|nr:DEAD/DEAH box helicase [Candidatus Binatia bacterium]
MANQIHFPLFERAERYGVLDGRSALISAPTATGKSHIGREAIRRALSRGDPGTHAYLVPYRALAEEVFDAFHDLLAGTEARLRIATGDYRDPLRPESADLVVATYESFAVLLRSGTFRVGTVVADEVHLVGDESRGPAVEGLFARLLASGRARTLIALSAVIENDGELARWLGVPLIKGTVDDRPVPLKLRWALVDDLDAGLLETLQPTLDGEQAIVFASSRAQAESVARYLAETLGPMKNGTRDGTLEALAARIREDDPEAAPLTELVPSGVAFHHAGLTKTTRRAVEQAFRDRRLRIIASTPTLAAGVNLPAGVVVVRDIRRYEVVRGRGRSVVLPSGEILNMLGRAARPLQVDRGIGVALVQRDLEHEDDVVELRRAIEQGQGGVVSSQLPESFEGTMRFVLAVVVERGEATRANIAAAYERTLAHHRAPTPIVFDRPFRDDLMEDIPEYRRVVEAGGRIRTVEHHLSPEGVHATVASDDRRYEVTIGVTEVSCTCPAASRYYRGRICKHAACAIHDLIFGDGVEPEARYRAIYNCGHVFSTRLDPGTKLDQALEILTAWRFLERVPNAWRTTPLGEVASASTFDLLLAHQVAERVVPATEAGYRDVAAWAVDDYLAKERDRQRWQRALAAWLDEVDQREIRLPTRYRGDFERGLEDLAGVCLLYAKAAEVLGRPQIAEAATDAAAAIRYGVAPELVPIIGLGLPGLRRGRSRYLYERGIRGLDDLARADPASLADPRRAPEALVAGWVERAREIHAARAVATADREEADEEFDELVARFRADPESLR